MMDNYDTQNHELGTQSPINVLNVHKN